LIDQGTIDRIMDAAQIVDVVSDFVSLRKRGVNYTGLCPFHDEKTPSFSVSPSKGICKCFSCGKGGNSVHFIMEHEQLTFYEALKYLAKKYNIEIVEKELSNEQKQAQSDRESMFILNGYAQQFFSNTLYNHPEGIAVGLAYFRERGFRDDVIKKFQLGYSPELRDALAQDAQRNSYKREFLVKTGLCIESDAQRLTDRFRGRVMFPVHTLSGKVVAFGGRILKKDDKTAKYFNSPESAIYHKSNELYGIYFAKQAVVKHDRCFLVEGYTDVLAMHQAGIENVVASSGTALTPGQIRMIHRFTPNITVIYDGDAAGIKASIRGIDLLLKEGMNIKVVLLPNGEDPDSFSKSRSASEFIDYIQSNEVDFIRFKTGLLLKEAGRDPIKRAELISDIVKSIALIPHDIIKSVYTKECSQLLEVDEKLLINQINKINLAELERDFAKNQTPPGANTATTNNIATPDFGEAPPPDFFYDEAGDVASPPKPEVATRNTELDYFEQEIALLILKYGNHKIYSYDNNEPPELIETFVCEYIQNELAMDEIALSHPVYATFLKECVERVQTPDFKSEKYFTQHPDQEVSRFAVEMSAERYQLSKIHSKYQSLESEAERLPDLVTRAIISLKDALLKQEIAQLNNSLRNATSTEEITTTQQRLLFLNSVRTRLAKILGDRIIIMR